MALINKIREKSGLAVGLVALGLMMFIVGGDILGPNSFILGNQSNNVGEIAGEKISYDEFQQQVEEMKYNYTLNFGRNPTETELYSIRQQSWEFLIVKHAFQKQFDELGLEVTEDEVVDMVQGNNIHPELAQVFTDPETGEIDRDQIIRYLQTISQAPQQQQAGWYLFEKNLRPSRLRIKYDNLMIMSNYATDAEAKNQHKMENTVAEVKYLYIPYYSVNDSLVEVSDDELRAYLKDHEDQYQVEESRSLRYVRFPIAPSGEDSVYFRQELDELKEDLANAENDSSFARINTDGQEYFNTYTVADLPSILQANASNLSEGDVRGPYQENGFYRLYKISEVTEDTVQAAKASHILIKPDTETADAKAEARQEAQRILNEIRGGASFEEMARQYSDDPSSSRGGDLGWFTEGRMVEPFEEAVFSVNSPQLINRIIETTYGYHIIRVTEAPTNTAYDVAIVDRMITPSDQTRNEAFRKADYFASTVDGYKEFSQLAGQDSLEVLNGENIQANDRRIDNLANARTIVRWLYNDAAMGEVSEVFELEDEYVVAVMTGKTDAGLSPLDEVRDEIVEEVKEQKKAEIIEQRLVDLEGSLEEMADNYGTDANVYTSSDLKLSSNSLPTVGVVPEAIGRVFGLEQGEKTEPVATDNGVLVLELLALTPATDIADYTNYKNQIQERSSGTVSYYLSEVIKEFSDIEDKRYRFY
ncbi:MAG: peptidylprolyl isomerase [Candidatus Cyclobacteriaceae bacterium M3_2C_046]